MSDAFILENLYQRQFEAKHQTPSNHTLTASTTTTTTASSTKTPSTTKPLGNTTTITANPNHTHP